jgi:hypothetical protein
MKFTFVIAWAAWCVVECAVRFELICAIVHPLNRTCSKVPLERRRGRTAHVATAERLNDSESVEFMHHQSWNMSRCYS